MNFFSRRSFLIGLATIGGGAALGYFTTPKQEPGEGRPITCPFLAMNPPDTRNIWSFARGCQVNGMDYVMALAVGVQITYQQKGLLAVLRHEAPDIHRLREVPGISHDDRYGPFLDELKPIAAGLAIDGRLKLQDLVTLKKWVAKEVGVEISEPSRIETALAFVRAGGDFKSWTVDMGELFILLSGQRPASRAEVNFSNLSQARSAANWDDV